jgi:DNA-directed RNA polymerase specialized sigma24 family protein
VERLESSKLDPELLSAWHAAHAESLRAFVYGLLRNHAAADEAVQSTFVQALVPGCFRWPSMKPWPFAGGPGSMSDACAGGR